MKRSVLFAALLATAAAAAHADYKQAVVYYNQGKFEKAAQEIKPDVEANPNWEPGHRILGLSYLGAKDYQRAAASLSRAVELKSTAPSVYLGLAEAYFNLNRYANVVSVLEAGEKYLRSNAEKATLYRLRGSAQYRLRRYNEAIEDLSAALRLSEGGFADYFQLGVAYFFTDRYDQAFAAFEKALQLKPGDKSVSEFMSRLYERRGIAALKNRQYARAAEDLTRAIASNPSGPLYYNLGVAQLSLNKYDDAEKALLRAAELMPDNFDALYRLGFIYEKRKQYQKAINYYKRAYNLSKDPKIKQSIDRASEAMAQATQQ